MWPCKRRPSFRPGNGACDRRLRRRPAPAGCDGAGRRSASAMGSGRATAGAPDRPGLRDRDRDPPRDRSRRSRERRDRRRRGQIPAEAPSVPRSCYDPLLLLTRLFCPPPGQGAGRRNRRGPVHPRPRRRTCRRRRPSRNTRDGVLRSRGRGGRAVTQAQEIQDPPPSAIPRARHTRGTQAAATPRRRRHAGGKGGFESPAALERRVHGRARLRVAVGNGRWMMPLSNHRKSACPRTRTMGFQSRRRPVARGPALPRRRIPDPDRAVARRHVHTIPPHGGAHMATTASPCGGRRR